MKEELTPSQKNIMQVFQNVAGDIQTKNEKKEAENKKKKEEYLKQRAEKLKEEEEQEIKKDKEKKKKREDRVSKAISSYKNELLEDVDLSDLKDGVLPDIPVSGKSKVRREEDDDGEDCEVVVKHGEKDNNATSQKINNVESEEPKSEVITESIVEENKSHNNHSVDEQCEKETRVFFDISTVVLEELKESSIENINEEVAKIREATLRAISLRHKETNPEDIVIKALEMVVDEKTKNISDDLCLTISKELEVLDIEKRVDFESSYSDFFEIMLISDRIKKQSFENTTLFDESEFRQRYLATSGLLFLPLMFYKKTLNQLSLSSDLSGKELRGAEVFAKYLENVEVVNIFKEDIFSIF